MIASSWQRSVLLRTSTTTLVTLSLTLVTSLIVTIPANAQTFFTYSVLHAFAGDSDGAGPLAAPLVQDGAGNLYGTTNYGGSTLCNTDGFHGCGTIFKVDKTGTHTVLYAFTGGVDGRNPYAGLFRDASGNLFGTTAGDFVDGGTPFGNIFELSSSGVFTVLYTFRGGSDAAYPIGGLIRDAGGNFYGVTNAGGSSSLGTVYKFDPQGRESVLYSFRGAPDGAHPLYENLVMDAAGNLYGTTYGGGTFDQGTVFKVNASTGVEEVLYSFANGADGGLPYSGLLLDAQGNLYGATSQGGGTGAGTIFKVDVHGIETVLYKFAGGRDGIFPLGGLVRDGHGNFWGTTLYGGARGLGTVFMVTPGAQETVVHSFNGADGDTPWSGLTRDMSAPLSSVFYGSTAAGGAFNFGTVFRIGN